MSNFIRQPRTNIATMQPPNLTDGRWRSPLFTFLSHTAGRARPSLQNRAQWMNFATQERHEVQLRYVHETITHRDMLRAHARFRSKVELRLLQLPSGLLQLAERRSERPEFTENGNRMWLCGGDALRALKKREDVRIRCLTLTPTLYGMWMGQLVPVAPAGSPGACPIYLFYEPLFNEAGCSGSVVEFDAALTTLRYRPVNQDGGMVAIDDGRMVACLCLESRGPVLQWENIA